MTTRFLNIVDGKLLSINCQGKFKEFQTNRFVVRKMWSNIYCCRSVALLPFSYRVKNIKAQKMCVKALVIERKRCTETSIIYGKRPFFYWEISNRGVLILSPCIITDILIPKYLRIRVNHSISILRIFIWNSFMTKSFFGKIACSRPTSLLKIQFIDPIAQFY